MATAMLNNGQSGIGTRPANTNRHLTPEELENNIGGLPVTDNKLRELFAQFDTSGNGWLDAADVKKAYLAQEHYGLPPSDKEIEELIDRHHVAKDGKVSYDEFATIWLTLARR